MDGWHFLRLPQKILLGGIVGSCSAIFMLNSGSQFHQQERAKAAQKLIASGRIDRCHIPIKDGQYASSEQLARLNKAFEHSAIYDDIWTREFVQKNFCLSLQNISEGRWHTMFTSGFNHGGPGHLLFNMLALGSTAPYFFKYIGTRAFLMTWIVSGITASTASLMESSILRAKAERNGDTDQAYRYKYRSSVGASGCIFGLFGATAILLPSLQLGLLFNLGAVPIRRGLAIMAAGSLLCFQAGWLPFIGHLAHVGGMAAGVLTGLVILRRSPSARLGLVLPFVFLDPIQRQLYRRSS